MSISTTLKQGTDLYFLYSFIRRLTLPFKETKAFELGIIDKNGKVLKKRSQLKSTEEKEAYTMTDTLIFNLKKILAKVPGGRTRFATFAAALFLLKEDHTYRHYSDQSFLREEFYKFMKLDESKNEIEYLSEEITKRSDYLEELSAGGGGIAGIGVEHPSKPGQAEPPGKSKVKKGRFAGRDTFIVDPNIFMKARFGKKKYHRYENYVGNDETGLAIRDYGRKYPKEPIILQDSMTGAMLYLRYGRDHALNQSNG